MEQHKYSISKWCTVSDETVSRLDQVVFEGEKGDFAAFAKAYYKANEIDYPKFFKMDALSKLAFIGSECLLMDEEFEKPSSDIALLFSNASSSLDTDLKHSESIVDKESFYPSPAVFVYTLANICLAEVSIKHKLQSENTFFVSPRFDIDLMHAQASYILETNRAKQVLCAWVEYLEGTYQFFGYMVSPYKQGEVEHTRESIKKIYKR
ncbi:3-oxoacyl-ACP synthase [Myroides marinus]|uniref:3-oxoacyl-ACP synthase n=1 Tax=Myroides marinus TaxID=703342 RepID=UPI002576FF76|nr:3-oxoacyl-ACP synthase [Myroides marinus]MDM1367484.1 3-oxoacyl-ACP synthase [Myroides marinus]MDM1370924.1 3-oxoacyl-ACP synthase [Myroides marinus]MDM1373983.1 3-oxoacyl-ACP synthase [Myroides marinus]MDM1383005.1 3-oxoacyl-ACP synthase [Myroides marinus]MDM1388456.1 3-oxoacyl-ACP synthase [Myroides marinus]